ncbi:HEPN domain-containing protein [uncultured Desulfobacter sp.]|uniref:HEPN domain-containing protein n=1 Tax=uncultured Desulfobacter sp. TaxID=240139 RepID=UPI002AA6ADC2|nr:HEPN domain-containing protein [uncultured Desulfobacter sp.]
MENSTILNKYDSLFKSLKSIIKITDSRILHEEPDFFFLTNINFFIKSYLISLCTYLEAYLQDIAYEYVKIVDQRISDAAIPNNYIHWKLKNDLKMKEMTFSDFDTHTLKKDLSDNLSGNPYKTIILFRHLGVDVAKGQDFQSYKDLVNSVVLKRNSIIHHNDEAMDISLSDLLHYIDIFVLYIKSIDQVILKKL